MYHTVKSRSRCILDDYHLSIFSVYFAVYGKNVAAVVEQPLEEEKMHPGKNTVTYEARELKSLFLRLV